MTVSIPFDPDRFRSAARYAALGLTADDRGFSLSRTSPDALGPDKAKALAADLQALAAQAAVDGVLSEILQSTALIARRP